MSTSATINGKEFFELLRDDSPPLSGSSAAIPSLMSEQSPRSANICAAVAESAFVPRCCCSPPSCFNYKGRGAVRLGAVVEIIHTATLVHDDIIDEAQTRRGRPAANTQWGNSKCVLAGDWLYMQAFKVAVQERNFRILDTLIELTQQMVEGELLQIEKLGKLISLDEHFDLIYPQDSLSVFGVHAAGCDTGWSYSGTGREPGQYGRDLGMAFQIVDDVLDLTATESVLGKPVASDLREGKVTMAVIHALERCTPAEREANRDHSAASEPSRRNPSRDYCHPRTLRLTRSVRTPRRAICRRWREMRFAVSPTTKSSGPSCGRRNM